MAKLLSGTRIYGTATVDTQLLVSGNIAVSSTITGALQVIGGIGVSGGGFFGGVVTATTFVGNLTGIATSSTTAAITNDTSSTAPQFFTFVSTSTGHTGIKTAAINGLTYIPNTGHVGFGIDNPTAAVHIVSADNNVIKFRGGTTGSVGVIYSDASKVMFTDQDTAETFAVLSSLNALSMSTNATERIRIDSTGSVIIFTTDNSTSPTTGALQVAGGVGISGSLQGTDAKFSGTVTATNFVGNLVGTATTATNIAGGAAGSLVYQTGTGYTALLPLSSTSGWFLSAGATAPQWTQTLSVTQGGTGVNTITGVVYGNGTTAFTSATGAQISTALGTTNIAGNAANVTGIVQTNNGGTGLSSWTAGDIAYYSAGTVLSKLPIGTSTFILSSSGTQPQWTSPFGISVGLSTTATNIAGGSIGQIPFQTGVGLTGFSSNLSWSTATNTLAATGTVQTTALIRTGNVSASAWTTVSPILHNAAALLTDTTSPAGTVAARVGVSLLAPSYASSNAITITDAVNLYVQSPVSSTGVTITNNWAIYNQGNSFVGGNEKITTSLAVGTYTPNSNSGDIVASGKVGIGTTSLSASLNVAGGTVITGITTVTNTTNATSTITGALQVVGGIGVGRSIYVGSGNNVVETSTWEKWKLVTVGTTAAARQGSDGNGLNFTSNALWNGAWVEDDITKKKFAYIQHLGNGRHEFRTAATGTGVTWTTGLTLDETAGTFTVPLSVNNTTNATSTATGALITTGGAGIARDLWVGGTIYGTVVGGVSGISTTATNASNIATISANTNSSYFLTFVDSNNTTSAFETLYTTSSFTINPTNGNVGHNKATPTEALYIERAGTQNLVFLNQTASSSVWTGMSIGYNGVEYFAAKGNVNTGEFQLGGKNASGYYTTIYSNNAETMRIVGGKVGIGTNNPGTMLEIQANDGGDTRSIQTFLQASSVYNPATANTFGKVVSGIRFNWYSDNWTIGAARGGGTGVDGFVISRNSSSTFVITANGAISFNGPTNYGTSGYLLQSNGDAPPTWAALSSLSAANSAQVNVIQRTTNAVHYLTFVDTNNAVSTSELLYTTSSFVINPGTGNAGLGTTPQYKLDVNGVISTNGAYRNTTDYFEKVFPSSAVFPHTVANQAVDIRIGNISVWGYIEVEVNSSYSNQNSTGKLTKLFAIGTNPTNLIYANESRLVDSMGTIPANITIGEFQWDATNTTYKIPISHIVSTGNNYTIKVRCFGFNGGADTILAGITISSVYTLTALAGHTGPYYNGNTGFGGQTLPAYPIDVTGGARITGSLGIGTAPSGVAGEIRATNEITAYYSSDIRLKENIKLIEDPITILNQIRGVYYDWKDEHIQQRGGEDGYFVRKHDIGVIAQEVQKVLPELVAEREDGFLAVKYEKLVPLLIESIKAQQEQIAQLSEAVAKLVNK